ncbi:hypothetical protein [Mechercharimyces sp. CAU 1602]|uniref:hypothetical protein n=1 Tax=Mechercharimyces sp. CAU 1602 TaxID=2973933 RepID=UPI0021616424|nr:hypothetical protein [Mechercharimyces sp. CAU 1602]MCS1350810.1 hypothetical protein [Mechercharimyces sp. CAU 1602]
MYMVIILIVMSVLAIIGTLYNKRTNNKPGFIIGGMFTLGLVGSTLLAIFDTVIGL